MDEVKGIRLSGDVSATCCWWDVAKAAQHDGNLSAVISNTKSQRSGRMEAIVAMVKRGVSRVWETGTWLAARSLEIALGLLWDGLVRGLRQQEGTLASFSMGLLIPVASICVFSIFPTTPILFILVVVCYLISLFPATFLFTTITAFVFSIDLPSVFRGMGSGFFIGIIVRLCCWMGSRILLYACYGIGVFFLTVASVLALTYLYNAVLTALSYVLTNVLEPLASVVKAALHALVYNVLEPLASVLLAALHALVYNVLEPLVWDSLCNFINRVKGAFGYQANNAAQDPAPHPDWTLGPFEES